MTASVSNQVPATSPHAAPASFSPMSFSGRGGEFLKMLVAGSLFQIPTFGFYRFWLTTKLRRHLWANTQIEGDAFEYTGTAKELLIGFLVALAILAPLYIAIFVLSFVLEEVAAFASIPLFLILYVLAHFGSYRARRYRATRTVFRGIRFWMKGSGWGYAGRAILWDVANLLTLGLALPWAAADLERYRMRHTYFGSVQGDFSGSGWVLFKRGWWLWALCWLALGGSMAVSFSIAAAFTKQKDAYASLGPLIAFFLLALLWPIMMAIFTRWHIDGLRIGDAVVTSRLRTGTLYGLFFKVLFSSLGYAVAFGIVFAIGGYLVARFFQEALIDMQFGDWTGGAIGIAVLGALAYLVFLLGFGIIQRYFLGRGLWAAIVSTTSVANLQSLERAVAAGGAAGSTGEGLADALDFNVGI